MEQTLDAPAPPVIKTEIAEYNATAAALAQLQHRFKGVVFDVTTTKGNTEARAARQELVRLRTTLEAKRVELKAPALERSRLIDAEAKRITGEIAALEVPIDQQIKAEEQRKEAERQAKIEAEQRRVAGIQARISEIRSAVAIVAASPSARVEEAIREVVAIEIGADFAEFQLEAATVKADALVKLRDLLVRAQEREAEQARNKAEREELERLRAADAARRAEEEQRAAAARAEEETRAAQARAAEAAKLQAEREAFEREQAAARAAQAEADRKAQAARDEADRLAREAREAEQRRLDAAAAELRRQQEAAAAEQRRKDEEARRLAQEAERQRIEQERARQEAEAAARTRVQEAAPQMLAVLQQWRAADELVGTRKEKDAALQEAKAQRDIAIAAALA